MKYILLFYVSVITFSKKVQEPFKIEQNVSQILKYIFSQPFMSKAIKSNYIPWCTFLSSCKTLAIINGRVWDENRKAVISLVFYLIDIEAGTIKIF